MPSFAWFRCLVLATVIASVQATFFNKLPSSTKSVAQTADRCFCELKGNVDECACSVDLVDRFNNYKIYPRLMSLLAKNYFRFFKVNLKKPCPFWADDSQCAMKSCAVQSCTEDNMPPRGILLSHNRSFATMFGPTNDPQLVRKEAEEAEEGGAAPAGQGCVEREAQELGLLNTTLTAQMSADLVKWKLHDDNQNSFCDVDDEDLQASVFVDLLLNAERYTGYKGPSPQRIWKSIYEENCFKPKRGYGPYIDSTNLGDLCLEKRAFYRAISGLHTSINIHLCAEYLHGHLVNSNPLAASEPAKWGPNIKEFQSRFDPESTNGEGPKRLRNLYFLYLLELRALAKAAPFLEQFHYYTDNAVDDAEVKAAVRDLLHHVTNFGPHFNESSMFTGGAQARKLKEEFRHHFRNITRIMDCVGCEKCRLWGKLQVQGLGTALKILFSGNLGDPAHHFDLKSMQKSRFQLSRSEIVSLLNAFGRLSNSIYQLENFRSSSTAT